jgi:hypothetical protein
VLSGGWSQYCFSQSQSILLITPVEGWSGWCSCPCPAGGGLSTSSHNPPSLVFSLQVKLGHINVLALPCWWYTTSHIPVPSSSHSRKGKTGQVSVPAPWPAIDDHSDMSHISPTSFFLL